jgi:hypothetical protein
MADPDVFGRLRGASSMFLGGPATAFGAGPVARECRRGCPMLAAWRKLRTSTASALGAPIRLATSGASVVKE